MSVRPRRCPVGGGVPSRMSARKASSSISNASSIDSEHASRRRLAATGRHAQDRRVVEPVRRRERQLDRRPPVRSGPPRDRPGSPAGSASRSTPRRRRRAGPSSATEPGNAPSGHMSTASTATAVPGHGPDDGQLVDDASEEDAPYSWPSVAAAGPIAAVGVGRVRGARARRRSDVGRRRQEMGEGELPSLVGWRTGTSIVRRAPTRTTSAATGRPPRRPGRRPSCSRAGV